MLRGMIEFSVWERTERENGYWGSRKIKRIAITFPYGKHGPRILKEKLNEILEQTDWSSASVAELAASESQARGGEWPFESVSRSCKKSRSTAPNSLKETNRVL